MLAGIAATVPFSVNGPRKATMRNDTDHEAGETVFAADGFTILAAIVILVALAVAAVLSAGFVSLLALPCIVVALFIAKGFVSLEPNEAAVVTLFGDYRGTVRDHGLRWIFPLCSSQKISLRTRNFETERLKVNDGAGNPVEIGGIVVWRVRDPAKAIFAVDSYTDFVTTQSEAALRGIAARYPYESDREGAVSLRDGRDDIDAALAEAVRARVREAGVEIVEARLSHLAYAAEIAAAMLQRQQADAVVAARARIVDGAVGIVSDALDRLRDDIDPAARSRLVSNLLVVLCGDRAVQPTVDLSDRRGDGA